MGTSPQASSPKRKVEIFRRDRPKPVKSSTAQGFRGLGFRGSGVQGFGGLGFRASLRLGPELQTEEGQLNLTPMTPNSRSSS